MRKILAIALLGLLVATSMPLASATEANVPALARSHCDGPTIDWAKCYVLTNDAVARAIYEAQWALGLVSNTTSDVCDHLTSSCPVFALSVSSEDAPASKGG